MAPAPGTADPAVELATRIANGGRLDLVGLPASGRTRVLVRVTHALEKHGRRPILIRVSPTIDKVEHAIVALAEAVGSDCAADVDERLRRAPGRVAPVIDVVRVHLADRPLLVDDADGLEMGAADDLHWMFRQDSSDLAAFFAARAGLRTTTLDADDSSPHRARMDVAKLPAEELLLPGVDLATIRKRVHDDAIRTRIAVARALLHYSETGDAFVDAAWNRWTEGAMLDEVWRLTDPEVRKLLEILAAHVRPLDEGTLAQLGIHEETLRRAGASRIIERDGAQIWLGRWWLPWIAQACDLHDAHDRLGRVFEMRVEKAEVGQHVAMLEAFRHYVAADEDLSRARHFLRHGVASLLERAHDLSARAGRWKAAARLYREVLDLDARLRKETPTEAAPIGRLPRAYATHYWHYNLYKDGAETIATTEAGYATALTDWSTNALFWSRLVVAKLVAGKWQEAFAALAKAKDSVPSARARDRRLIERTTRKLLERSAQQTELAIAALAVWQDHRPDDPIRGESTMRALERAMIRGAQTRVLPARRPLVLHVAVRVAFTKTDSAWACSLDELDVTARATTMIEALERSVAQLRDEAQKLLNTPTHRLDVQQRDRKRVLLGRIDVVASQLTGPADAETWILAIVERASGPAVVRTLENAVLDTAGVEIPTKRDDDDLWLVRVAADATGAATSKVLAFEEPLTGEGSDAIWRRWAARWQQHA